ncbi:putative enzyme of the cupin superfamily [Thioflavicoccus mobilis 8321]|uniref:Putative enzyme of the cupin superfamily n=1 Tax=Thioflavicoccus mobilis 8321 TaxID=765912 RepID=L0GZA5_9GAMM|nr:cupin domain-containing protein [Thioflavicoccus mobilis]AGA91167.1 putative enzyme of the cupin superfamily [Thioflavicoccus mobilis 8321]
MDDLTILHEHKPSPAKLEVLGVEDWPIWTKEVSTFPWRYDREETCYVLRGRFTVTPEGGAPQTFGRGDLITFPAGLSCTWEIHQPVEKHYRLG